MFDNTLREVMAFRIILQHATFVMHFLFSGRPRRQMWPGVARCGRVWPGASGCGRVRADAAVCERMRPDFFQAAAAATTNIAFTCRNAKNRSCVSGDGVPEGSLNRASPTAARHGGQGGAKHDSQIMRPYPLPFAAPRAMAAEGCV